MSAEGPRPSPVNELDALLDERAAVNRNAHVKAMGYNHALAKLLDHMVEISDDPSGSDPEEYLNDDELLICRAFMARVNALEHPDGYPAGWSNADDMVNLTSRIPGLPAWKNYRKVAMLPSVQKLLFRDTGEGYKGYTFGRLATSPTQVVAICNDGKLRSLRGRELPRSYAFGWGKLPDRDLLRPHRTTGSMSFIDYRHPTGNDLAKRLVANIPPGFLGDTYPR